MDFFRIRALREDNDLSQEDISNIIGVKRSTYSGWETGRNTIPLRKLNLLANYYNVSIDYLTGLSNKKTYNLKNQEINLKIFSKRLKNFRLNNNLRQKDLYILLNTTSSTYSAYETGKTLMQTAFIYEIAKKYNLSIDWLLGKY